jgi:hypothetical protein
MKRRSSVAIDGVYHWPCQSCNQLLHPSSFYADKRSPSGLRTHCKSCVCNQAEAARYRDRPRTIASRRLVAFSEEWLSDRLAMEPNSGCWLWTGGSRGNGYGAIHGEDAHRVFYRQFKGEIPRGMVVMHKCDTRPCCNPDHLTIGTPADNVHDMISKGRHWWNKPCSNASVATTGET